MAKLPGITEQQFTRQVIQYAQLNGWLVAHFRPGRTATGWTTAVQGDGKGFPDLVMLREHLQVVAELKVGKGKCTPEQTEWLARFEMVGGCHAYVWYPTDWSQIERVLGRKP